VIILKLSEIAYNILAEIICDDEKKYKYRTKDEINSLFYGKIKNVDEIELSLSRRKLTVQYLKNCRDINLIFKEITDFRNFEKRHITATEISSAINNVLRVENMELVKEDNNLYKLVSINKNELVKDRTISKNEILSVEYIEEHLKKMEEKILKKDYSGAITNSRSLVEHIIRDLANKLETEYLDNNLKKSFANIQEKLNMNPKDYSYDGFKKIIQGLVNIVDGIYEIRNKVSDSHSRVYEATEHHAVLCVNSARTFSNFIVESYLYQKQKGILKN